ncbi:MAG: His/Gly/Thr/Pro-type tRNA ligase C-terminal domain-containing protein, partial [Trichlorobacter sp.]|nr:His/Gly/Thr/Pro-type tRNA ligase C-terminal domain-containing protein [Trichlorobacter sp.]
LGDQNFTQEPDLFIAALGDNARNKAFALMADLQKLGLWVETDCEGKSLKGQMRRADKLNSRFCMVLGDEEINNNHAKLKLMADGTETEILLEVKQIAEKVKAL